MVQRRQDQVTTQAGAKASVSTFNFYPVGRAVQAAVCRTAEAGAIPARDSISSSIGVERYTPCGRPQGPSKPEYRARYPDARPFLATRTGVSQDFTGLVAAIQLRLRVAFGLQALQRCSGLLNRRARGSTVATHHFADVAQQRQQQFRKLPGALPHESANLSIGSISSIRGEIKITLRFERRVCRWESCRMHQFTGMWLNPNSRGSRLRIWQPWGCKSLHAHHLTATGFSGNSRPRRLKIAEPSGCKSRVADQPSLVELRLGKPACG